MAKMFYTRQEVQEKLGLTVELVKQLVQDGRLREFRDGPNVLFKVDEVDKLAGADLSVGEQEPQADLSGSDSEIQLAPLDSSAGLEAAQEGSDQFDMAATDDADQLAGRSGSEIGLVPEDSGADRISLDDTTQAADKDDTVITSHGVDVVDASDENLEMVDPLAQTQLAPDLADQVDLDSSGSGLLDLTREADDTSLGAELLEEIYPGGEEGGESQVPTQMNLDVPVPVETGGQGMELQPAPLAEYAVAGGTFDPSSSSYGVMMLVPLLLMAYLGFVAAASLTDVRPKVLETIAGSIWYVVGGGAGLALLIFVIGSVLAGQAAKPQASNIAKTAKTKTKGKKQKGQKK